jgi:ribosomal protein S18 acetylase RimI-like enzyme
VTIPLAADPHADWPDRTPLYDDDGELLLVFTLAESTRSGRPWADGAWRPDDAAVAAVRDVVLEAMPGYAFSTSDTELAEALLGAGAERMRHAHAMSHQLTSLPDAAAASPNVQIEPLSAAELFADAEIYGDINYRAYAPGHPDHEHADAESAAREMRGIALGHILGPYLTVSQVARVDDTVVGACLVVDREGKPPEGGPWIIDVFREPDATEPGIGRSLIAHALHATQRAGLPGLSLAVSDENANAIGLYTSLGFLEAGQSLTLALPTSPS